MAEGYTQSFVINKYVYNESQSTSIPVPGEQLSFDGQNEIKTFEYLQREITFYDAQSEVVGNYIISDIHEYNGANLFIDVVKWNGTELSDGDVQNVPYDGGVFDVYYVGDFEPETTLTLSPTILTLSVGETKVITATTNSEQSITWSSDETAIATVDNSGTVTAISEGTTTITASVEDITKSCTVTVSAPSVYTLNIYNSTNSVIIKTIDDVPKGVKINKYIYETGVYNEINNREGYYISEWLNHDNKATITDNQTMDSDLSICPVYTEIPTEYYSKVYLPNLTQRFPLGAGASYTLGDKGGEETHKLTTTEMPSHNHNLSYIDSNRSGEDQYYSYGNEIDPTVKSGRIDTCVSDDQYMINVSGVKNEVGAYFGDFITKTGGDGSHNNMPPYLVVNFIIKYK